MPGVRLRYPNELFWREVPPRRIVPRGEQSACDQSTISGFTIQTLHGILYNSDSAVLPSKRDSP